MLPRQFLRIIAQEIGAHIGFSGVVVGNGWMKLRHQNCSLNRSVRIGGLLELRGQDRTDKLIRFILRTEKVAQRISCKDFSSVLSNQPLGILQHMRMSAHDHIGTPVG